MTDTPPAGGSDVVDDRRFIDEFMYHGRSSRRPWAGLAGLGSAGLAFVAGGIWMYQDLAAWEAGGGQRTMGTAMALLYRLGGKGLVAGLTVGFGLFALAAALSIFRRDRQVARTAEPAARAE